ncbi:sensor domain-containing diguanylate cyclase [Vibrio sp. Vb2880]|uniref:transporter substrate-binding domain-containing diguanylate cyclase n=1 Tax=Vibrio TaxID=662 RepID=UPI00296527C4|nr:sensor domain-containing diguanylate cyclase [Vibrio sp. Vb2880]MDW1575693.1 sensor domain-containing diguanylate cyclase [Vibrio sp. Vb2880]
MSSTSYGTYGCKCKKACASLLLLWLSICPMAHAHKSESHSLIVANSKAWKPFSYLSPDGEPKGILIDFWKEYAVNNQIDVQFLLLDWDASLQAVKEGKADFHGGLVYSPEIAKYMDFGAVIMPIQTKLYVNKDVLSVDIRSVLTGEMTLPIGVVKGSYESEFVQTNYPNAPIAEYINNDSMIQAAVDKKVLYFVADLQVANFYMATTPGAGMFVPTISLYSKDLRIAAGMHSATSILEVSRAFEKVIDTDRERILTRWSLVKTVYPLYLFPIAIFIMAVATLYHIFALKRMVALRTRQLTIANQQLLEMTLTDSLTKLYNRRHLIEQLALLNHLKRNLTVMVFDIDDFKSINDRYGHLAGDRAIVAIADAAKSMTDDRMTLARIGGEEFALVTSSLSEREALNFANMLCKAVYDQPVILGGQAIHLSISLGCAYYPEFTHIVSLQDADELMYQGKSEGKNRAVFQVITDCQLQPALRQVN